MTQQLIVASFDPNGTPLGSVPFSDPCGARFYARDLARGGTLPTGSRVELQRYVNGKTIVLNTLHVSSRKKTLQG
jgi:hypothetical protein